jgi:hypothetical protein
MEQRGIYRPCVCGGRRGGGSPVTAVAGSLIIRLRQAGATLACGDDGKVRFSAPAPLPAALLAEARKYRDDIAAALTGDAPEPRGPGGIANAWAPAERAAALARLLLQRSEAISAAAHTADALPAGPQDGPLDPSPPAAAPALLAYIRDRLRCRVTLVGNLVMIAPTWRCPPRVVAAAQRVAPQLRELLQAEGVPMRS